MAGAASADELRVRELEAQLAQARDALTDARARAERLDRIARHAPDYIMELDRSGVITFMNRPAPGKTLDDMLGTNVEQWMEEPYRPAFHAALREVMETATMRSYESVGSVSGRYYINRISPVIEGEEVLGAILVTHDVTERRQAEERLLESEQRYRALVTSAFEGLALNADGVILEANQALADMLGYTRESLVGKHARDLTTPESSELVMKRIRAGSEEPYEVIGVRADGTTFPCEILGRNITIDGRAARITAFRDLTARRRAEEQRRRLEEQMTHAQRLETLGLLAGGVAHDFNNYLQVLLGQAEIGLSRLPADAEARDQLARICDVCLHASDLTRQLLAYAGQGRLDIAPHSLDEIVRDMLALIRVSIPKKAHLDLQCAADLPWVMSDGGQLRQVIVNLIVNAADALHDGHGNIVVRTGRASLSAVDLSAMRFDATAGPGHYVFFEVEDDGVGMDAATLTRVFEPFFTTKHSGRGLGLATTIGIVRASRGAIEVQSQRGQGTRFRVYLPEAGVPARVDDAGAAPATDDALTGTVLIADDEPLVREAATSVLSSAGLSVLTARDGIEAVRVFTEHAPEVDLVVLDLGMPDRGGSDALRLMRETVPALPAVLMSGYAESDDIDALNASFLAKPFSAAELRRVVRERLASARRAR